MGDPRSFVGLIVCLTAAITSLVRGCISGIVKGKNDPTDALGESLDFIEPRQTHKAVWLMSYMPGVECCMTAQPGQGRGSPE